jgi:glycosyltransferase involved in cell wall biosynthesis
MKITFVLPHAGLAGGIKVVAIYADRLQKRGHDVVVVSTPLPPLSLKHKIKTLLREGFWPKQLVEPSHFHGLDVDHRIIEKCRPIIDDDVPDADVVIATWWETAEWVNLLSDSKGRKVYFIQGYDVRADQPIARVQQTYHYPFIKIAVSNWLRYTIARDCGDKNISLVSNSVDTTFFSSPEKSKQLRPTIGFVYSPVHCKGSDIVIEAIHAVRRILPNMRIVVFGVRDPLAEFPLPSHTEFYLRPTQEKIRDIYMCCDFWLFGSREEGFGLPVLEAMACRTPVIATRAGAAPELLSQGGGILLTDKSPATMAQAIIEGFNMSETQWRTMSDCARQTVTHYSWDDATTLFEQALTEPKPYASNSR